MVGLTKVFHLHVRRCLFFPTTKYQRLGRCPVYCFIYSADGGLEIGQSITFDTMVGLTKVFLLHVRGCLLSPITKYRRLGRCPVYCFNDSADGTKIYHQQNE
jgi:hypothetical protein